MRRKHMTIAGVTAASVAACVLIVLSQQAGARETLGKKWAGNAYVSMDQINHQPYDALLHKYVDGDGYVNYRAWHASSEDREALRQYLIQLSRASASLRASRESQFAFWINAYNAVTLEGILREYPTDSIRNHTSKLGGYNIWKDLPLLVGGTEYPLNTMEHQVLRKMGDPRIHFAIVCASVGCPRLLNEAYVGAKLEQQLSANTRDFFSRRQNFTIDGQGAMHVSSILDWFGSDFGKSQAEQFRYLQPYLPAAAQNVAANPRTKVTFQNYNWSLNDQSRKSASLSQARPR